jgi:probable rRNA maturation factor
LGDIIVSLDKACEQAEEYGHDKEREVAFLVVHGFLHLLGFDHDTKEREELMLENAYGILNTAGFKR